MAQTSKTSSKTDEMKRPSGFTELVDTVEQISLVYKLLGVPEPTTWLRSVKNIIEIGRI